MGAPINSYFSPFLVAAGQDDGYAAAARHRRRVLARHIKSGAVVITAATPAPRSRDTHYHPYRFDGYFYYLSACEEPNAALIMQVQNGEVLREVLLCRPRNAACERWQGERLGVLRAKRRLLFDETADIEKFPKLLDEVTDKNDNVYFLPGANTALDRRLCELAKTRRLGHSHIKALFDVSAILDDMRLIKDKTEIARLRLAAQLTGEGHKAAMKAAMHARRESEVGAAITAVFECCGGQHAFPPVVAAGENALTLHYTVNSAACPNNKLLLVDAGCEWRGYAGDVSRSFPVRGKFSIEQGDVYDIVLAAQKKAIAAAKPGAKFDEVGNAARRALKDGLIALGLGKSRKTVSDKVLNRFYMHRIGHFLGLDVHDVGVIKASSPSPRLRPGMVITVEPGLYIPNDNDIPRALRGMGVRIEDDVLITPSGRQVLSDNAPKTRLAIEAWMNA